MSNGPLVVPLMMRVRRAIPPTNPKSFAVFSLYASIVSSSTSSVDVKWIVSAFNDNDNAIPTDE